MQQKLNDTQKAQMLTNQLSGELEALEGINSDNKNEPHFSQGNGSQGKTIYNKTVTNSSNNVNKNFGEESPETGGWEKPIPLKSTAAAPTFPFIVCPMC